MSWVTSYSNLVTTLTVGSGDHAGKEIRGRGPGQTLRVVGTTALASITGYNSGTAGAGTAPTHLVKPTGGTNWVADELAGKWLKRTGGGGYVANAHADNFRPIESNGTTDVTIASMPGLDDTSTFEIVTLASTIDRISSADLVALRVANCLGPVELVGLNWSTAHTLDSLLEIQDCSDVRLIACEINQNLSAPAALIERCGRVRIEHCLQKSSGDIEVSKFAHLEVTELLSQGGGILDVQRGASADVILSATDAPSRVLSISGVDSIEVVADSTDAGGTPFYFENTKGSAILAGTNPDALHGMEIAKNAQMTVAGSTVTGDGHDGVDQLIGSYEVSNADLTGTTYGLVVDFGLSIIGNAGWTKALIPGNALHLGESQYSSRVLTFGLFNPSQSVGITAAGTSVSDAFQLPAVEHVGIGTCASGAGVKLHNSSVLPGPRTWIYNAAANACLVYPSNGGTINGGASYSLPVGALRVFVCVDYATDKWVTVSA